MPQYYQPQYTSAGYYQQNAQQQQQSSSGNFITVLVSSESEMINYPVAAGFTVLLIDFEHKKFWLKSTAMNGVPQQPRSFSFTEEAPKIQNEEQSVSRKEFDELNAKLDKLVAALGGNE